jgi:hypothetical protein
MRILNIIINKKAHPISQVSFEYFEKLFLSLNTDLSIPILSGGIGTFSFALHRFYLYPGEQRIGCQGFIGPYPSAFLDKHPYVIFKSWRKDNRECRKFQKTNSNPIFLQTDV